MRQGIEQNYKFVRSVVASAVGMFENSEVSCFVSLLCVVNGSHDCVAMVTFICVMIVAMHGYINVCHDCVTVVTLIMYVAIV